MGRIIAIASGKGGTGKSFFTVNLGTILAEKGEKVLLVDADTGASELDGYLDLLCEAKGSFLEVMLQEESLNDVILQDSRCENLYLLSGSVFGDNLWFSENDIKSFFEHLKETYDYVLVDCPSGSNDHVTNVIKGADELIMVVLPTFASIRNADILSEKLKRDEFFNISFVLNCMNERLIEQKRILSEGEAIEILENPLLGCLPEDERVVCSLNYGEVFVREHKRATMTACLNKIAERVQMGLFYRFMLRQ